jgi:hypothetical protein
VNAFAANVANAANVRRWTFARANGRTPPRTCGVRGERLRERSPKFLRKWYKYCLCT